MTKPEHNEDNVYVSKLNQDLRAAYERTAKIQERHPTLDVGILGQRVGRGPRRD